MISAYGKTRKIFSVHLNIRKFQMIIMTIEYDANGSTTTTNTTSTSSIRI